MSSAATDRQQRLYGTTVRAIKLLACGLPLSRLDLAAGIPCSVDAADDAIKFLHAHGLIHVARWARIKGPPRAYWQIGAGEDAAVPPKKTSAERSREWKARGGDQHRARRLRSEQLRIERHASLAGQLTMRTQA